MKLTQVNTFFDQQHFENQSLNCFALEFRDYSERLFFYLCSCILKPYTPLNPHSLNHLIPFRFLLVMKYFHKIEVLLETVLFRWLCQFIPCIFSFIKTMHIPKITKEGLDNSVHLTLNSFMFGRSQTSANASSIWQWVIILSSEIFFQLLLIFSITYAGYSKLGIVNDLRSFLS